MTVFTGRTSVTTTLTNNRLGGAYLLDWQGDYILDWEGNRIIVIVPGGNLSITTWTGRTIPA